MDKLRPVLKQMFWIATGFVILLAVCGWWVAMGSLHEQIEADTKKVDTANTASKSGGDAASAAWTAAAKSVNEADRQKFEAAEADLHRRQQKYRTYPPKIAKELRAETFGSPINDTALRGEYGKLYEGQFLEQLKVLNPFIVQDNAGLIDVDVDQISKANPSEWPNRRPSSVQLWKAQEDLWLLRSLFESINTANAGADRLGKAPVRQLISLYMRGGKKGGGSDPSGGGGGRGGRGRRGREEPQESWEWDSPGGNEKDKDQETADDGAAVGLVGGPSAGASFEGDLESDLLTEEYGPDPTGGRVRPRGGGMRDRGSLGGDGGLSLMGVLQARGLGASAGGGGAGSAFSIPGMSGGAQASPSMEKQLAMRYVDDSAEYRTRAFLLHVRVHHAHLPVLLAELTNSSFPVEIVRVNAQFRGTGSESGGGRGRGGKPRGRAREDDGGLMSGRRRSLMGRSSVFGANGRGRGSGATAGGLLDRLSSGKFNPMVAEQGESHRRTALSDPALAEVKIAGLMTIYRSKEENEAVEQTLKEEVGAQEAAAAAASPGGGAAEQTGEMLLDSPAGASEGAGETGAEDAGAEDQNAEGGENAEGGQESPGDLDAAGEQEAVGDPAADGEESSNADSDTSDSASETELAP